MKKSTLTRVSRNDVVGVREAYGRTLREKGLPEGCKSEKGWSILTFDVITGTLWRSRWNNAWPGWTRERIHHSTLTQSRTGTLSRKKWLAKLRKTGLKWICWKPKERKMQRTLATSTGTLNQPVLQVWHTPMGNVNSPWALNEQTWFFFRDNSNGAASNETQQFNDVWLQCLHLY